MKLASRGTIVLAVQLLAPALTIAQTPQVLSYQGRLLKTDGTPEVGPVLVRFSLFRYATGGKAVWSEEQSVGLTDGFFAVYLGDASTPGALASVIDGSELWLELSVGDEAMTPRQRLASAPYALMCSSAQSLKGGSIDAASIAVKGNPVIDASGNWVGSTTGLEGPQGPRGETGQAGKDGAPGAAGQKGDKGDPGSAGPSKVWYGYQRGYQWASAEGLLYKFVVNSDQAGYVLVHFDMEVQSSVYNTASDCAISAKLSDKIERPRVPPANSNLCSTCTDETVLYVSKTLPDISGLGGGTTHTMSLSKVFSVVAGNNTIYVNGATNCTANVLWHGAIGTAVFTKNYASAALTTE